MKNYFKVTFILTIMGLFLWGMCYSFDANLEIINLSKDYNIKYINPMLFLVVIVILIIISKFAKISKFFKIILLLLTTIGLINFIIIGVIYVINLSNGEQYKEKIIYNYQQVALEEIRNNKEIIKKDIDINKKIEILTKVRIGLRKEDYLKEENLYIYENSSIFLKDVKEYIDNERKNILSTGGDINEYYLDTINIINNLLNKKNKLYLDVIGINEITSLVIKNANSDIVKINNNTFNKINEFYKDYIENVEDIVKNSIKLEKDLSKNTYMKMRMVYRWPLYDYNNTIKILDEKYINILDNKNNEMIDMSLKNYIGKKLINGTIPIYNLNVKDKIFNEYKKFLENKNKIKKESVEIKKIS